jgi:hypothetical protein
MFIRPARSCQDSTPKRQVRAREIEREEIDATRFRDRYDPNSVQLRPQAAE